MDGLVYVGGGSVWVIGNQPVPPRNLSPDEVKRYGGKRALLKSGLYAEVKAKAEAEVKIEEFENEVTNGDWI